MIYNRSFVNDLAVVFSHYFLLTMEGVKSTSIALESTETKLFNKTFTANPAEIAKRLNRPSCPITTKRNFVPPTTQPVAVLFKSSSINSLVSTNKKSIPIVMNSA